MDTRTPCRLAVGLGVWMIAMGGTVLGLALADPSSPQSKTSSGASGEKHSFACPDVHEAVDKKLATLDIITDAPLPSVKPAPPPTPDQVKCVETFRTAGKQAIEKRKIAEGAYRYVTAAKVVPATAENTYMELANVLDRGAYTEPALAAYLKAWEAYEVIYNRPGAKLDGIAILAMADIRDSIIRIGGRMPAPTSEAGRTVVSQPTRRLREQYFSTDPLISPPEKPQ